MALARSFGGLLLVLIASLVFAIAPGARATQEAPTMRTAPPPAAEPPSEAPATESKTEVERYTLSHDRYEKAVSYSRAGYALYFLSVFVTLATLFLALRLQVVARIRDAALRVSENRLAQGCVFIALLVLLVDLAELPVHVAWHALSLQYQQSVQRWPSWFADVAKSEAINALFMLLMGLILFFVIRKSPRRWWFYFWLAALPIILAAFFLEPLVIDPLFYKFQPLAKSDPELAGKLEKLTARAGLNIPRERMFLMNASSKTNQLNAYVTGFGASKRVVIYDNLVRNMTPQETLFVFGHESGHYVLNHVRNAILFFAASLLFALWLAYRLLNWSLNRWGARWKVYGPQDWGALAVLLLLLEGISFLALPVVNGYSRVVEHNADVFGLEVIHGLVPDSSRVAAHAFQIMGEIDLSDPNPPPFITFWLYSHPPLAERLVFAHSYDPWSKNQAPRYIRTK